MEDFTPQRPGSEEDWSESLYFNFHDRENDITAFMRIGLKPNRGHKEAFLFIMTDDMVCGMRSAIPIDDSGMSVNGLSFRKEGGGWRLSYNGQLGSMTEDGPIPIEASLDILWTPLNEEFDYRRCVDERAERMAAAVAAEHREQYGEAVGAVSLGTKRLRLRGLGERDHSWGVRDWNAPLEWMWINCHLDRRTSLNLTRLVVDQGEVVAGFVHRDGESHPIVRARVETRYSSKGGPQSFDLDITDSEGKRHIIGGSVVRETVLPFEKDGVRSLLYETLSEYDWKGGKGYGIAEYLIRT